MPPRRRKRLVAAMDRHTVTSHRLECARRPARLEWALNARSEHAHVTRSEHAHAPRFAPTEQVVRLRGRQLPRYGADVAQAVDAVRGVVRAVW